MSTISFSYDDTHSVYINTRKNGESIIRAPEAETSKNITDWEVNGDVTFSEQEVATIDNQDGGNRSISKIIDVNQATVGDILFRAMVRAEGVENSGNTFGLYADVRHHDDTWEYSKEIQLPVGDFNWTQASMTIESDAGKTIKWLYPYLMLNRKGKASFKFPEIIDLTDTVLSEVGEVYSKPECIFEPATLTGPQGGLKLDLTAYVYGSIDNINLKSSPAHSIEILSKCQHVIVNDPGLLTARQKYITDALKGTVKLWGYSSLADTPTPTMDELKMVVDRIATEGWHGVFLDCYGYDWGNTRARQNEIVDYAHSKGLKCFANGWNQDDVLGNKVDATYNPDGTTTHLGPEDWSLLESFLMYNGGYTEDIQDTMAKCKKVKEYKANLGVNIACLTYRRNGTTWEQATADAKLSYLTALLCGFDGWWFVDAIESDAFLYQPDPALDLGGTLTVQLEQLTAYWYVAETDKYLVIINTENYPPLTYAVYDKAKERALPQGTTILYSDDLETWSEYDTESPGLIGKFVREKKAIS